MAVQWTALVDAQGNLVSTGTVVADAATLAAKGLTAIPLPAPPDFTNSLWDSTLRAFVPIQTVDRVQDFVSAHQAMLNALPAPQQAALQTALASLLGPLRFRHQNDPVNIT